MKKTLLLFFLVFWVLFFLSQANANIGKYQSEIDECNQAYKDWSTLNIEDFVCINDKNEQKRAYQIVLDKEFKKIDKEWEKFILDLEKNKNYYFGEKKKEDFLNWFSAIESIFWWNKDLFLKYKALCDYWILQETINYFPWSSTTITQWLNFLKDEKSDCMGLVMTKLKINALVSYNILKLNKEQVRKDSKKTYTQKERTFMDKLWESFSTNLSYVERIWQKTPTMIKHPY